MSYISHFNNSIYFSAFQFGVTPAFTYSFYRNGIISSIIWYPCLTFVVCLCMGYLTCVLFNGWILHLSCQKQKYYAWHWWMCYYDTTWRMEKRRGVLAPWGCFRQRRGSTMKEKHADPTSSWGREVEARAEHMQIEADVKGGGSLGWGVMVFVKDCVSQQDLPLWCSLRFHTKRERCALASPSWGTYMYCRGGRLRACPRTTLVGSAECCGAPMKAQSKEYYCIESTQTQLYMLVCACAAIGSQEAQSLLGKYTHRTLTGKRVRW